MFKFRKTINIFIITYNVFIWFSFAIGNILEVVKMIYSITFNQSIPLCNVKDSIVQLFSKWCVVLWRVPIPFQESIKIKLFRILQCYFPPPPVCYTCTLGVKTVVGKLIYLYYVKAVAPKCISSYCSPPNHAFTVRKA